MLRQHFPKLQIGNPAEVLVSSDIRTYQNLVLSSTGSSFCYRVYLNFQVYPLRDIAAWELEGFRVLQKGSYRPRFC